MPDSYHAAALGPGGHRRLSAEITHRDYTGSCGAAVLQPVSQRPPGVQDMSLRDSAGALGVFVAECVEQLLVLVERVLLMVGEQGKEVTRNDARRLLDLGHQPRG